MNERPRKLMDVTIPPSMLDRTEIAGTGISVQELLDSYQSLLDGKSDHEMPDIIGYDAAPRTVEIRGALKAFWRDGDGNLVIR